MNRTSLPYLTDDLSLAAVNGPELCVVSGETAAIDALAERSWRQLDMDVESFTPLMPSILK
ncbi:hypothetical protein ACEQPO_05135 [Bacillus sp. SL00103]